MAGGQPRFAPCNLGGSSRADCTRRKTRKGSRYSASPTQLYPTRCLSEPRSTAVVRDRARSPPGSTSLARSLTPTGRSTAHPRGQYRHRNRARNDYFDLLELGSA